LECRIAFLVSFLKGILRWMYLWYVGKISAIVRFKISWKCSTHQWHCSSFSEVISQFVAFHWALWSSEPFCQFLVLIVQPLHTRYFCFPLLFLLPLTGRLSSNVCAGVGSSQLPSMPADTVPLLLLCFPLIPILHNQALHCLLRSLPCSAPAPLSPEATECVGRCPHPTVSTECGSVG
jgi:hypothetical protein